MEEEDNENYKVCKLVLVGESGVGKTCITSRFVSDHFSNDNVSTSSASYCSKTLKIDEFSDKYIKFNIWDTCGQEKFRSLSKVFYKGIKAAILVYDITNINSFNEIKSFWYNQLKENSPKDINKFLFYLIFFIFIVIAIAANKCDLYQEEKVKEEEAQEYAQSIGAIFENTSACKNVGILEIFKRIGEKLFSLNIIEKDDENKKKNKNEKHIKLDKKNIKKKKKKC